MIAYAIVARLEPKVDKFILSFSGEKKILEIKKHWAASVWPMMKLVAGMAILLWATFADLQAETNDEAYSLDFYWLFFIVSLALCLRGLWQVLMEFRDRFVITNQRIFRVDGVLSTNRASIPIVRILDITVKQSWLGKRLNYGHFIFESAAQIQGLNEITYVRDPDEREKILHLAIRGDEMHEMVTLEEDDGT